MYEGKYLNGKKLGKGKEYNTNGELIFEGEYFNGERKNGKNYKKCHLLFEGEFVKEKYSKGKEYNEKGN